MSQAIHMGISLETSWVGLKVGWGPVSGNQRHEANHVSQVDGVSMEVLPLCGSVCRRVHKRYNGCCLASGVLSRSKLSPRTHHDARYFGLSPYATGASSCTLVLEPRGSDSA